jgi:hypothetical protein
MDAAKISIRANTHLHVSINTQWISDSKFLISDKAAFIQIQKSEIRNQESRFQCRPVICSGLPFEEEFHDRHQNYITGI